MPKIALTVVMAVAVIMTVSGDSFGASARCKVLKKTGEVLVIDCGSRAEGFREGAKIKVKTDRDGAPSKK